MVLIALVSLLLATACLEARGEAVSPATPTPAGLHGDETGFTMTEASPTRLHCSICHKPLSEQTEMPAAHPVDHRERCLMCHSTMSPWTFPESHEAAFNQACQICHTPSEIK